MFLLPFWKLFLLSLKTVVKKPHLFMFSWYERIKVFSTWLDLAWLGTDIVTTFCLYFSCYKVLPVRWFRGSCQGRLSAWGAGSGKGERRIWRVKQNQTFQQYEGKLSPFYNNDDNKNNNKNNNDDDNNNNIFI